MARAGLGQDWRCTLACDIDEAKASTYKANWGPDDLVIGDVRDLGPASVPERLDLVWMSPPCQDWSEAGPREGEDGTRSGAIWPAVDLIRRLHDLGRSPRLVVVENVTGMATTRRGLGLTALVEALASAGYRVGALVMDAKLFVPQSRPRLFVVAVAKDIHLPAGLVSAEPSRHWHPAALIKIAAALPAATRDRWVWWVPPMPPRRQDELRDILDGDDLAKWHDADATSALLALMTPDAARRLDAARRDDRIVGTLARRMRPGTGEGREQRAELRLDGVAGCILAAAGGSSQHAVVVADTTGIHTRQLTVRENARLMGLPESYRLPLRRDEALRLVGEGVVVPAVRHLAATLLEPLLEAIEPAPAAIPRRGIRGATRSTTLYLLPQELTRLRRLAVDLDVSIHDLVLRGLDHVLSEHGQHPLVRYR